MNNSIQNYFIVTYHVQMDRTKSQELFKSSPKEQLEDLEF